MASTDAKQTPLWGVAHRLVFPILDSTGSLVTGAAALDSEISKDQGTFIDCTNEAIEIATASGVYYLDLTATEMEADCIAIIVKTSTVGAKTTVLVLYTDPATRTRKAAGGAAGTITLDSSAVATDNFYNGQLVRIVGNTGVGQVRMISSYVGSSKVATVVPNWVTNPDNTSIFQIIPTADIMVRLIDTYTLEQIFRVLAAYAAGRTSGGILDDTVRAIDNSKARLTATLDANGHRQTVTVDAT